VLELFPLTVSFRDYKNEKGLATPEEVIGRLCWSDLNIPTTFSGPTNMSSPQKRNSFWSDDTKRSIATSYWH
jgi:hypothetical protein